MFCRDNPKNTRFCINFFTSIGLGALTEKLREFLSNAEMMIAENYMVNPDEIESSDDDSSSNSSDMQRSNKMPRVHTSPLSESLPQLSASGGMKIMSSPLSLY